MNYVKVLVPFVLPIAYLMVLGVGGGVGVGLPALILFVGVPLADWLVGEDRSEAAASSGPAWIDRAVAWAPAGFVLLHLGCLVGGVVHAASAVAPMELGLSIVSLGAIGSIGITAAHELIHKKDLWSKVWGRTGLVLVAYLHFEINHLYGHHRNACTSQDLSTGWYGESVYAYLRRSVPGCFRLSWALQRQLLERAGHGPWHLRNLVIWSVVLPVVVSVGIVVTLGSVAAVVYLLSSAIAVLLLEVVAYIEHYGLMRDTSPTGHVRRMESHHSWDSYYTVSGAMTFMLQRHADHHRIATRSYHDLTVHDDAPELPYGYPVMITLALVPPMWRRVMHPRLAKLGCAGARSEHPPTSQTDPAPTASKRCTAPQASRLSECHGA